MSETNQTNTGNDEKMTLDAFITKAHELGIFSEKAIAYAYGCHHTTVKRHADKMRREGRLQ